MPFTKAFDKVGCAGLHHKLKSYGVFDAAFRLIESIVTDRKIKVVLDGQCSH